MCQQFSDRPIPAAVVLTSLEIKSRVLLVWDRDKTKYKWGWDQNKTKTGLGYYNTRIFSLILRWNTHFLFTRDRGFHLFSHISTISSLHFDCSNCSICSCSSKSCSSATGSGMGCSVCLVFSALWEKMTENIAVHYRCGYNSIIERWVCHKTITHAASFLRDHRCTGDFSKSRE